MHKGTKKSFALQVEGNANIHMKNPIGLPKVYFVMLREMHKILWLFICYSIQTVSGRLAKKIIQKRNCKAKMSDLQVSNKELWS